MVTEARKQYARDYYAKNREKINAYQLARYHREKEKITAQRKLLPSQQHTPKVTPNPPMTKAGRPDMRFIGRKWGVRRVDKAEYMRIYDRRPERLASARRRYWESGGARPRPGWTREMRARLMAEQNGRCAICGVGFADVKRGAAQDHDWTTGKARGLLCINCNHLLGKAKDSVDTLRKAIVYLEQYV